MIGACASFCHKMWTWSIAYCLVVVFFFGLKLACAWLCLESSKGIFCLVSVEDDLLHIILPHELLEYGTSEWFNLTF